MCRSDPNNPNILTFAYIGAGMFGGGSINYLLVEHLLTRPQKAEPTFVQPDRSRSQHNKSQFMQTLLHLHSHDARRKFNHASILKKLAQIQFHVKHFNVSAPRVRF